MPDSLGTVPAARVLIVDDEPAICSALSHLLRRAGFDPVIALGPPEAELLLSAGIDAMVLDLRMPHMRGDVFFYLATARFPHLRRRTLFITGDITSDAERMITHTGCAYLEKPFQNAELIAALRRFFPQPEAREVAR
ncbi:MAG: response regulator [Gemmatimonadetes bacterium]|nr:response regulator [Gemmatimonadota bacterium]